MLKINTKLAAFKFSRRKKDIHSVFYSPSPEYLAACCRDEWRGEPRRSSVERRRVGYGAIPLDTPPLAVGSFIDFLAGGFVE